MTDQQRIAALEAELLNAQRRIHELELQLQKLQPQPHEWDKSKALQLRQQGWSYSKIAEYFGYSKDSRGYISRLLSEES